MSMAPRAVGQKESSRLGGGFREFLAEGLAGNTEDLGRLALVAVDLAEDLDDVGPLHGFQRPGLARDLLGQRPVGRARERHGELIGLDRVAGAEDHESLDEVLELAYVAGPA